MLEILVVSRWDITNIDKLPPTIRTSFLALFNTTNNVGLEILKEQGFNPIPYIRKMVTFSVTVLELILVFLFVFLLGFS